MRGVTKYRDGLVSATLDQRELIKSIDSVTKGAATQFVKAAEDRLVPIKTGAYARWPVRTGGSRRSIALRTKVGDSSISVKLSAAHSHMYYMRFSRYTTEDIERLASQAAAAVAGHYHIPGYPRGSGGRQHSTNKQTGARVSLPADGDVLGWLALRTCRIKRSRDFALARTLRLQALHAMHGWGAPSRELAGKHVWSTLVGKPFKMASKDIGTDLQDVMDRLAGGL